MQHQIIPQNDMNNDEWEEDTVEKNIFEEIDPFEETNKKLYQFATKKFGRTIACGPVVVSDDNWSISTQCLYKLAEAISMGESPDYSCLKQYKSDKSGFTTDPVNIPEPSDFEVEQLRHWLVKNHKNRNKNWFLSNRNYMSIHDALSDAVKIIQDLSDEN